MCEIVLCSHSSSKMGIKVGFTGDISLWSLAVLPSNEKHVVGEPPVITMFVN